MHERSHSNWILYARRFAGTLSIAAPASGPSGDPAHRACIVLRICDTAEEEFRLAEAHEDDVTAALRAVIENNLRQTGSIPGFNRRSYESVVRQGQVANFDGTRLTKSPDLCFKLRHDDCGSRMVLSEFDGALRRMQTRGRCSLRWSRLLRRWPYPIRPRRLRMGHAGRHDARLCSRWQNHCRSFNSRAE